MTHSLIYTLFSAYDSVAILVLMFSLFKIPMKHLKYQIILVSVTLGYLSYTIRVIDDISAIAFVFQTIGLFLFVWLMFRIQVFYALLITVTAYVIFGCVQLVIIFSAQWIFNFQLNDLANKFPLIYTLQIITDTLILLISKLLVNRKIGFNFVPHDDLEKTKFSRENIIILFTIILLVSFVGIIFAFSINNFEHINATFLFASTGVAMIVLLAFAFQKEKNDDY